jgi:Hydrolytic ATP binding site of dynein motor region
VSLACSVLRVAGVMKRAEPDLDEATVLMKALRDFNMPKVVQEDAAVFLALVGDLFPGITAEAKVDDEFELNCRVRCSSCKEYACFLAWHLTGWLLLNSLQVACEALQLQVIIGCC